MVSIYVYIIYIDNNSSHSYPAIGEEEAMNLTTNFRHNILIRDGHGCIGARKSTLGLRSFRHVLGKAIG
jgi:hypothetical protein